MQLMSGLPLVLKWAAWATNIRNEQSDKSWSQCWLLLKVPDSQTWRKASSIVPIPLREADLLAVVRLTSTLEVETAAESLSRNYRTDYDAGTMTSLITAMINARRDLAGRLLEQIAELWATGASPEELITALGNMPYNIAVPVPQSSVHWHSWLFCQSA